MLVSVSNIKEMPISGRTSKTRWSSTDLPSVAGAVHIAAGRR